MNKISIFAILLMTTTPLFANEIDKSICRNKGGIYYEGVCTEVSLGAETFLALANEHRRPGGNEKSIGDTIIQGDIKVEKNVGGNTIKNIYINVSMVPKTSVLDYQEKVEQNFHNQHRLRADGYLDRPWMLAHIGTELELSQNQELTILAGSFEANGLNALDGKPSRYYMTAPYGLIVRYDQGIQFNYALKDEMDRIILASFGLIDGDTVKGQSDLRPDNSVANSYPGYSGKLEVDVAKALQKTFSNLSGFLEDHNLYMGVTGSVNDVGSYKGEKRVQDDLISYVGYMVDIGKGEAEVRVFQSKYTRNPIGNGLGKHTDLVYSNASGIEVAFRNFKTNLCDVDLYGNINRFESNGTLPDGEFTWNNMNKVEAWAIGASCKNFARIDNLDLGVEYGKTYAYDKNGDIIGKNTGMQFGLVLSYKIGTKPKKNNRK